MILTAAEYPVSWDYDPDAPDYAPAFWRAPRPEPRRDARTLERIRSAVTSRVPSSTNTAHGPTARLRRATSRATSWDRPRLPRRQRPIRMTRTAIAEALTFAAILALAWLALAFLSPA